MMETDDQVIDVETDVPSVVEPPPSGKNGRGRPRKPKDEQVKAAAKKIKITPPRSLETMPVPWTVVRLERLRPGERFCFYRGNLQADYSARSIRPMTARQDTRGCCSRLWR
jgi:hypothetical protein